MVEDETPPIEDTLMQVLKELVLLNSQVKGLIQSVERQNTLMHSLLETSSIAAAVSASFPKKGKYGR